MRFPAIVKNHLGPLSYQATHIETIFIECLTENRPLYIGMTYHRSGTSITIFEDDLSSILENIGSKCILMGDFNVNMLKEANDSVFSFTNNLREYSFRPLIIKPTRVFNKSISLIDHIWVNFEPLNNHYNSNIIFVDITDHFPIVYHHELRRPLQETKCIKFRKTGERYDRNFRKLI